MVGCGCRFFTLAVVSLLPSVRLLADIHTHIVLRQPGGHRSSTSEWDYFASWIPATCLAVMMNNPPMEIIKWLQKKIYYPRFGSSLNSTWLWTPSTRPTTFQIALRWFESWLNLFYPRSCAENEVCSICGRSPFPIDLAAAVSNSAAMIRELIPPLSWSDWDGRRCWKHPLHLHSVTTRSRQSPDIVAVVLAANREAVHIPTNCGQQAACYISTVPAAGWASLDVMKKIAQENMGNMAVVLPDDGSV